ncbi:hypothetical protein [Roseibium aggregatum]|uniref:hypothetical protein n=1 Tax=Roseibium aggregatum TaxID=187304 RepID=UPI003A96EDA4
MITLKASDQEEQRPFRPRFFSGTTNWATAPGMHRNGQQVAKEGLKRTNTSQNANARYRRNPTDKSSDFREKWSE